ncbi:MAG: DNA-binding protein [Spirochaetaceae bacterium]|nr:MAG: DNA-binding protein [Spirochaetaceae bacterium]
MDKQFLKIENAAKLIDVSPWTIRKWIKERNLPSYRFGGGVRIRESYLSAYATVMPGKKSIAEIQNIP